MALEVFSSKRDAHSVAYDIALGLSLARNPNGSPKEILASIKSLMPECLEAANELYKQENKGTGYVDFGVKF